MKLDLDLVPADDDEPIQYYFGHYADWLRPDMVNAVLNATDQFTNEEHAVIIGAEAVHAASFLSLN